MLNKAQSDIHKKHQIIMTQEDNRTNLEKDYQVTLARLDKARTEYSRIAPQT